MAKLPAQIKEGLMRKRLMHGVLIGGILGGGFASCVDQSDPNRVQQDPDLETAAQKVDSTLFLAQRIEEDISRGNLLTSFRSKEKQEIEDLLYEIKIGLLRLKANTADKKALLDLKITIDDLAARSFLRVDEARIDELIVATKKVVDLLGAYHDLDLLVIEELYTHYFTKDFGEFRQVNQVDGASWTVDQDYSQAKVSGLGHSESDVWLVTPVLDLTDVKQPSFQIDQGLAFFTSWDGMEIKISKDYQSGNPEAATWEPLILNEVPLGEQNWGFAKSERYDLSAYAGGSVVIAFHYHPADGDSPVWLLRYFKVFGDGNMTSVPVNVAGEDRENPADSGEGNDLPVDAENFIFNASFSGGSLGEMTADNVLGDQNWFADDFNGDEFAKISGFNSEIKAAEVNEDWLVSPAIDLAEASQPYLQLRQAIAFFNGENRWNDLKIMISTNLGEVESREDADWQPVTIEKRPPYLDDKGESLNWSWAVSEKISLENVAGQTIWLAAVYRSSAEQAVTWEIDYLRVGDLATETP
jgi:hypothetical protein